MTKPWTERRAAAINAHCENMRPGSSIDHTDTFKDAWEIRTSFEAGAQFGYEQGLADAKAESPSHAQIDESEIKKYVFKKMDCDCGYEGPDSDHGEDAPMCHRCELMTIVARHEETARFTHTADSERSDKGNHDGK